MLEYTPVINAILLVIFIFYQKNKNKLLSDHVKSQGELLAESKSLINQLVSGMSGQRDVVEAAMRYAEGFDPEKFGEMIRKQAKAEMEEQITELQERISHITEENKEKLVSDLPVIFNDLVHWAAREASHISLVTFSEPIALFMASIESIPDEEIRRKRIEKIENENFRILVQAFVSGDYSKLEEMHVQPATFPDDLADKLRKFEE